MPTNMMVPLMGRHETNDFALDDIYRRQMLAQQLAAAGSQPQAYGPGIGPGLSSLGQGIGAALQRVKAQHLVQQYNQAHTAGMQLLANTLMNGGNMAGIVSQLPPELQGEALNTIAQNMQLQRQMQMQQAERQFELNKIDYANKSKANYDPQLQNQMRYNQAQDMIGKTQAQLANEQDPAKQQELQQQLNNLNATSDSYIQRLRNEKGQVPDLRKEYTNQALQTMQSGGQATPAQIAALGTYGTPAPETAFQKAIGEKTANITAEKMDSYNKEAQAVMDMTAQGDQILQLLTANPNIQSGPGRDTMTKLQTFADQYLPGFFTNLADQQLFQKDLGLIGVKGIGKLRGVGVQKITQSEIQNVMPLYTPTITNGVQGITKILELNDAISPAIQKGVAAYNALVDQYNKNPRNIDFNSAFNDLYNATDEEVTNSSLNFMNKDIASQGYKVIKNPQYDPVNNPGNKYIRVPLDNNGPGATPGAGPSVPPAAPPVAPNANPMPANAAPSAPPVAPGNAAMPQQMPPQAAAQGAMPYLTPAMMYPQVNPNVNNNNNNEDDEEDK